MATLPGWLCVEGDEIINSCRTLSYIRDGFAPAWSPGLAECDCCCPTVDAGDYTFPDDVEGNPAPWFDPNRPESADFFGVLVRDMHMSTPLAPSSVDSSTGRSCPIPVPRVISIEADLVTSSAAATAYAREWIVRALSAPCISGCCPSRNAEILLWCEALNSGTAPTASLRTLIDIRLVSFEILEGEDSYENCTGARFNAVLEVEPFIFAEPIACVIDGTWDLSEGICLDWSCEDCPGPPEPPAPDPLDPCAPQPPIARKSVV